MNSKDFAILLKEQDFIKRININFKMIRYSLLCFVPKEYLLREKEKIIKEILKNLNKVDINSFKEKRDKKMRLYLYDIGDEEESVVRFSLFPYTMRIVERDFENLSMKYYKVHDIKTALIEKGKIKLINKNYEQEYKAKDQLSHLIEIYLAENEPYLEKKFGIGRR